MKNLTSTLIAAFIFAFCGNIADAEIIYGHEYVDLGVPSGTLWATCNLGAETPYQIGTYYAWGEIEKKATYTIENYEFFAEFASDPDFGYYIECQNIGTDICESEYDAVTQTWGGEWRMPNYEEIRELRINCWYKWVEENGVKGMRFYGPNGNSIFVMAAGYMDYELGGFGYYGRYWTGIEKLVVGLLIGNFFSEGIIRAGILVWSLELA